MNCYIIKEVNGVYVRSLESVEEVQPGSVIEWIDDYNVNSAYGNTKEFIRIAEIG